MQKKALVVIDIQNEITKNYKEVIGNINRAIDWAVASGMHVVYFRHENLSLGARVLLPNTKGSELVTDLKVVQGNVFVKSKMNILTCEEFVSFVEVNGIDEFYLVGADATICVKSTCYNLRKKGYAVTVPADCVASWNMKQIPEMLKYYEGQGSRVIGVKDL
jgi:nicotinamidase-related amidase